MRIIETCPKCGHDLVDLVLTTYPPIPQKKCFNCGWEWTGEREEIVRVPFGGNTCTSDRTNIHVGIQGFGKSTINLDNYILERYVPVQPSDAGYESSPCIHCSNNPKNGGSGVCHCILGLPEIKW